MNDEQIDDDHPLVLAPPAADGLTDREHDLGLTRRDHLATLAVVAGISGAVVLGGVLLGVALALVRGGAVCW